MARLLGNLKAARSGLIRQDDDTVEQGGGVGSLPCVVSSHLLLGAFLLGMASMANAQDSSSGQPLDLNVRFGLAVRAGVGYMQTSAWQGDEYSDHDTIPVAGMELFGGVATQQGRLEYGLAIRDYQVFLLNACVFLQAQPWDSGLNLRGGLGSAMTVFLTRSRVLNPTYFIGVGWAFSDSPSAAGWFVELSVERHELELERTEAGHTKWRLSPLTLGLLAWGYRW